MSYIIFVKLLNRDKIFSYKVKSYEVDKGDMIKFKDPVTNKIKRYHSSNCEIEEVNSK